MFLYLDVISFSRRHVYYVGFILCFVILSSIPLNFVLLIDHTSSGPNQGLEYLSNLLHGLFSTVSNGNAVHLASKRTETSTTSSLPLNQELSGIMARREGPAWQSTTRPVQYEQKVVPNEPNQSKTNKSSLEGTKAAQNEHKRLKALAAEEARGPGRPSQTPGVALEQTSLASSKYDRERFCVHNKLLPSLFVIGVQKCGTTTLDFIFNQVNTLSHGRKKEHHFFDHDDKLKTHNYMDEFPLCERKDIHRTFDNTPNYTNPTSNTAKNIYDYYDERKLPLNQLIFVAMICSNQRRVRSAFYMRRKEGLMFNYFKHNQFNQWFTFIMENTNQDLGAILQRGFYDEIFSNYFDTFPTSKFIFVDSDYAFRHINDTGNALMEHVFLQEQEFHYVHANKNRARKQKLTAGNKAKLKSFYANHEARFVKLVNEYSLAAIITKNENFEL